MWPELTCSAPESQWGLCFLFSAPILCPQIYIWLRMGLGGGVSWSLLLIFVHPPWELGHRLGRNPHPQGGAFPNPEGLTTLISDRPSPANSSASSSAPTRECRRWAAATLRTCWRPTGSGYDGTRMTPSRILLTGFLLLSVAAVLEGGPLGSDGGGAGPAFLDLVPRQLFPVSKPTASSRLVQLGLDQQNKLNVHYY